MNRYGWLILTLLVPAGPAALGAQDTEWNRYTLEGLAGAHVSAEAAPACEAAGVTAADVRAAAARLLLETDVSPLTREEMLADAGLPELEIAVECAEGEGGALGFALAIRLKQAVKLVRSEQVTLPEAVTWYATEVGVVQAAGAPAAVEAALGRQIERFAAAYTAANTETEKEKEDPRG